MSLMRVEKKSWDGKLTLKKDLELKSSGTYSSRERGRFCGSSFDTVCWHEYKDDLTWPTYMGTSILSSKVLDRAPDLGFYSSLLGNACTPLPIWLRYPKEITWINCKVSLCKAIQNIFIASSDLFVKSLDYYILHMPKNLVKIDVFLLILNTTR